MPNSRGLVTPAIVTSTIVLILCSISWGALGVYSLPATDDLPVALHRYLSMLLTTLTLCAAMVNLSARIVRAIRVCARGAAGDDYAAGYADGVTAQPEAPVARLPRARR